MRKGSKFFATFFQKKLGESFDFADTLPRGGEQKVCLTDALAQLSPSRELPKPVGFN